jgi:fermentation-respiration switch protein FrsA (DUF1100 family)
MTNSIDITGAADAPAFLAADELTRWRATAVDGATVVYYSGSGLARHRSRDIRLDATAWCAWSLYLGGQAVLTQAQPSPGLFEYRATAANLAPPIERDRTPTQSIAPKVTTKPRKAAEAV